MLGDCRRLGCAKSQAQQQAQNARTHARTRTHAHAHARARARAHTGQHDLSRSDTLAAGPKLRVLGVGFESVPARVRVGATRAAPVADVAALASVFELALDLQNTTGEQSLGGASARPAPRARQACQECRAGGL